MKKKFDLTVILGSFGILLLLIFVIQSFTGGGNSNSARFSNKQYEIFFRLFEKLDYKIQKYYNSSIPKTENSVFFLFDYHTDDFDYVDKLVNKIKNGGDLFILGINSDFDPITSHRIVSKLIGNLTIKNEYSQDIQALTLEEAKVFEKDMNEDIILDSKNGPLMVKIKKNQGNIFLVSDSIVIQNKILHQFDYAIFWNNILKKYYKHNIYLLYKKMYYTSTNSPISVLFNNDLIFLTLQLLLIGLFFAFWKAKRFGNPIELDPFKRRTLTEHLLGVGVFYKKTKSLRIIDRINIQYFIIHLRKLLGFSTKKDFKSLVNNTSKLLKIKQDDLEILIREDYYSEIHLMEKEKNREKMIEKINQKRKK